MQDAARTSVSCSLRLTKGSRHSNPSISHYPLSHAQPAWANARLIWLCALPNRAVRTPDARCASTHCPKGVMYRCTDRGAPAPMLSPGGKKGGGGRFSGRLQTS